jgi:hypothetical protein
MRSEDENWGRGFGWMDERDERDGSHLEAKMMEDVC